MSNSRSSCSVKLTIRDSELILLPEKAVIVPGFNALLVADLHLGKSRHFRKNGLPVPSGAESETLKRLSELIENQKPDVVIFLGDLFHSSMNDDWRELEGFIRLRDRTDFILIRGNHDVFSEKIYARSGLVVEEQLKAGEFLLTHEPIKSETENLYNLCGHLHPGFSVRGKGRQRMRLPCFYFDQNTGVLPAFGVFTGLAIINERKNRQIFVAAGGGVFAVKPLLG